MKARWTARWRGGKSRDGVRKRARTSRAARAASASPRARSGCAICAVDREYPPPNHDARFPFRRPTVRLRSCAFPVPAACCCTPLRFRSLRHRRHRPGVCSAADCRRGPDCGRCCCWARRIFDLPSVSAFAGNPPLFPPEARFRRRQRFTICRPEGTLHFPGDARDSWPGDRHRKAGCSRKCRHCAFASATMLPEAARAARCAVGRAIVVARTTTPSWRFSDRHGAARWCEWRAVAALVNPLRLRPRGRSTRTRSPEHRSSSRFPPVDALRRMRTRAGCSPAGDASIFVAYDSADVGAAELFFRCRSRPTVVAGVPPDYSSARPPPWATRHRLGRMSARGFAVDRASARCSRRWTACASITSSASIALLEIPASSKRPTVSTCPGPGALLPEGDQGALGRRRSSPRTSAWSRPRSSAMRDRFAFPGTKKSRSSLRGDWARTSMFPHHG